MTSLALRTLLPEDVGALAALAQREGRNVHAGEYERFLRLEGAAGIAVEQDGALVGAITAIRYFEHGFLGPAVVQRGPDAVGIALLLIGRAVEGLLRSGAAYVETEASAEEAALLRPLGFETLRRTLVLEREPGAGRPSLSTVSFEDPHLLDVGILDAGVAGFGRKEYIAQLTREVPQSARVLERHGEVEGYIVARRSRRGYHLGPLVTRDAGSEGARDLVRDAVAPIASWPIVALVPEPSALLRDLAAEGFAQVGTLERMRAGRGPAAPAEPTATEWLLGGRITG